MLRERENEREREKHSPRQANVKDLFEPQRGILRRLGNIPHGREFPGRLVRQETKGVLVSVQPLMDQQECAKDGSDADELHAGL